jgi:hypothetical protein
VAIAFNANGGVAQSSAVTSSGTTAAFNTKAGDIVVVQVMIITVGSIVSTVTDLAGNKYFNIPTATINDGSVVRLETWVSFAKTANASNTVTINLSGNSIFVAEASSFTGASGVGNAASSTQSSANPTQSLTTKNPSSYIVAGFAGSGTGTFTISTGTDAGHVDATTLIGGAQGYNTATAPGSLTVAYTNTDTAWAMGVIELVVSMPASWMTTERIGVGSGYDRTVVAPFATSSSDFVKPTLPQQLIPTVPMLGWKVYPEAAKNAQPQMHASPDLWIKPTLPQQNIVTVPMMTGPRQYPPTSTFKIRGYARVFPDIGPSNPPTSAPITLSNWTPTIGSISRISGYARSISSGGPAAPPPIFTTDSWKSTDGQNSQPLTYSAPVDAIKPVLIPTAQAAVTYLPGRTSTDGQVSVTLKYATTDFVSQANPTLVLTSLGFIPYDAILAQPQKYALVDYSSSPAKFNLPAAFVSQWYGIDGQKSIVLNYTKSDYVNQVRPTLATLPTLLSGLAEIPWSEFVKFAQGDTFSAPAKFGVIAPTTPTIDSWTSTIGQNAVILRYALTDFINQVKPTLATLPVLSGLAEIPWSEFNKFQPGDNLSAPAKFGLIAPATTFVSEWTPTSGQNAVVLKYAQPDFVNQLLPTHVLTSLGFLLYDAIKSQPQSYALVDWSAPAKFGLTTPIVVTISGWSPTIGAVQNLRGYARSRSDINPAVVSPTSAVSPISWRGEDVYFPKFDWYSMGDTSTGPADAVAINEALSQETLGVNSQPQRYAAPVWTAPTRFGLIQAATPTVDSWTSTTGQNAVVLRYAEAGLVVPTRLGLIVVVSPTIESWTPTTGQNAVELNYLQCDFSSQANPTLVLTSLGFIPYDAILAQPQKYAPTDWNGQIKADLGTLPVFLYDLTVPNAQPQRYAATDWTAPAKFGITIAATTFLPGWQSTDGKSAVVLKYAASDFVTQNNPTRVLLPISFVPLQNQFFSSTYFSVAVEDVSVTVVSPIIPNPADWSSTIGQSAVVLTYSGPTEQNDFGLTKLLSQFTISGWQSTDGKQAVTLKYAVPNFVSQDRPTLALLPTSTAFLAFVPPNALPQKFATTDYVNQINPTLATLANGLATDFTVWNRRANPPTFTLGDIFTSPTEFALSTPPGSIIIRNIIFYNPVAGTLQFNEELIETVIVNGIVMRIVIVR